MSTIWKEEKDKIKNIIKNVEKISERAKSILVPRNPINAWTSALNINTKNRICGHS